MADGPALGRGHVLLVSVGAGITLGGAAVLFEKRGTFDCDSWVESCTVSWAIFWAVLVLPWLTAVAYFVKRRSMTLLSGCALVVCLSGGAAVWLLVSFDQATSYSQADHDESRFLFQLFMVFLAVAYAAATVAACFLAGLVASRRQRRGGEEGPVPGDGSDPAKSV